MEENKVKINFNFHEQLESKKNWVKEDDKDYKEYRRKWEENPKNYVIERGPIHLDIEPSSICNLRCPMCGVTVDAAKGKDKVIKAGLMDFELYKKIIDEAAELGVSSVKLNWRGEPTLNPRLADMVRYAKEHNILDIMINTNAVKLDEKLSNELIDAGLDKMFFSVDSHIPENYEKIRVGAKFEEVMKNIRYFTELNEKKGHPVYTRVQKVLLNETQEENEKFIEYFADIVDQIAFEDYIPFGDEKLGKKVVRGELIKFACSQLWQRLLITWDGEFRICCPSGSKDYHVGNINEQSIESIWQGEFLRRYREFHVAGEWYNCELCKDCYVPYM